jgi:4-hydroxybenzoyl-CoA thioesterase/acyl-CoA thioester hydrolase
MPHTFRTRRFVEFSDTDMAGIAHFSSFFRYMESAEHELVRSVGLSVFHVVDEAHTLSFPRVSAQCDYKSPAWCEDELDIAITIERLGKKSVTYTFEFTRQDDTDDVNQATTHVATGRIACVCCQLEPGRPPFAVELPEEIAAKLRPFVR